MKTVFLVEGHTADNGSIRTGVQTPLTPPDDYPSPASSFSSSAFPKATADLAGWMEFWDYQGGASFRAFVAEDRNERTLFAFFDTGLMGRDLKPALIALLELSDDSLGCSQIIICLDRRFPEVDAKALMKSFQWVGFELTTLDHWARELDVTSDRWLFMGMEV